MKHTNSLRIIFMGTPDFAVESLQLLHQKGHQIVAVITATDKFGGRGRKKLLESPVKQYAKSNDIPILQPKNLKHPEFLEELRSFHADLQVVVAFRMLPIAVWDMPPLGTINLHASYLPAYRGAAPINWAIINQETETGITIFRLKHKIDTGDIIWQERIPISPKETAGSLHDSLMKQGAIALERVVQRIQDGKAKYKEQDLMVKAPKAPKLFLEDCQIDFSWECKKIDAFVRGLCPYPLAWFSVDRKLIKVYRIDYQEGNSIIGLIKKTKDDVRVGCKDGWIILQKVKPQGKGRMSGSEWKNGLHWNSQQVQWKELSH